MEFAFELPAAPGNPFERDVWAEVTPPGAPTASFPAFHDGGNLWRVRVRASVAGKYELGAVSEKSGEIVSPLAVSAVGPRAKEYSDPPARPAIGIDPANPRGFRCADGAIYYPVGMNIAWGQDYSYPRAFAELAEAGGNWARLWMAHWGGTDLSWHEPEEGPSPAPGMLDLDVARRWDRRLAAADAHGIYVQMVFQHHGQFSSDVNPSWPQHPWNRANGGFLTNPADFFTDPAAIRHTRWKYRYIVARYGWSPAVLAWELFNEVHFTDAWKNEFREADVVRWHAEMAAWIRANDVYRHLITTSTDNLGGAVWRSMDYYQPHLYAVNMLAHARRFPAVPRPPDKPLFYGELGDDSQFFANPEDKASGAGIMPPLWSGLMADGVLPPQPWYRDRLLGKPLWAEYVAWAQFIQAAGLPARHTGLQEFTPLVETAARVPHVLTAGMTWAEREPLDLTVPDDGREPAALADVPGLLPGQFGNAGGDEQVWIAPFHKTSRFELAMGLVRNDQALLDAVQQNHLPQIEVCMFHEQPRVLLVQDVAGDGDLHSIGLGEVVVRHREEALHLPLEHAFDAAALRINHVEVHHRLGEEGIAVDLQRRVLADDLVQVAGQEAPHVGDQDGRRRFHHVHPPAQAVVLMCDGVVQCLADHPRVVLRNLLREKCAAGQGADVQIADAPEHAIHLKQEGWAEVLVIQLPVLGILENPGNPGHRG